MEKSAEEAIAEGSKKYELLFESFLPTTTELFRGKFGRDYEELREDGWNISVLPPPHVKWKKFTKKTTKFKRAIDFVQNLIDQIDIYNLEIQLEESYVDDTNSRESERRVNMSFYGWSAFRDLMNSFKNPESGVAPSNVTLFTAFWKIVAPMMGFLIFHDSDKTKKKHFLNPDNELFVLLKKVTEFNEKVQFKNINKKVNFEKLLTEGFYSASRKQMIEMGVSEENIIFFKSAARKIFNLSKSVADQGKKRTEDNKALGVEKPLIIPYNEITTLARVFWMGMLGDTPLKDVSIGDFSKNKMIKKNEQIAYAFCLLELCSGSRSQGIVANNRIDYYDHVLEIDKKTKKDEKDGMFEIESTKDVKKLYDMALGNIIIVDNLSKQKSDTKKAMTMFAKFEGKSADPSEIDKLLEYKKRERAKIVIKPILYDYFDPDIIFPGREVQYSNDLFDEKKRKIQNWQTFVFLDILCACRDSMYSKSDDDRCVKEMQINIGRRYHTLLYISSKDECKEHAKELHKDIKKIKTNMREIVAPKNIERSLELFGLKKITSNGLFEYGKKTHQLRKIYVAVAYMFYTDQTQKEISFAKYVLGHEDLNTSLAYISVRIIKSIEQNDLTTWLIKDTMNSREKINFLIEQIQDKVLEATLFDNRVAFVSEKGVKVWLEKFPRSKRNRDHLIGEKEREKRIVDAVRILKENDIQVSTFTVRMLGVQVTGSEIREHRDSDGIFRLEEEFKKREKEDGGDEMDYKHAYDDSKKKRKKTTKSDLDTDDDLEVYSKKIKKGRRDEKEKKDELVVDYLEWGLGEDDE